jgi:hypothetical protein
MGSFNLIPSRENFLSANAALAWSPHSTRQDGASAQIEKAMGAMIEKILHAFHPSHLSNGVVGGEKDPRSVVFSHIQVGCACLVGIHTIKVETMEDHSAVRGQRVRGGLLPRLNALLSFR